LEEIFAFYKSNHLASPAAKEKKRKASESDLPQQSKKTKKSGGSVDSEPGHTDLNGDVQMSDAKPSKKAAKEADQTAPSKNDATLLVSSPEPSAEPGNPDKKEKEKKKKKKDRNPEDMNGLAPLNGHSTDADNTALPSSSKKKEKNEDPPASPPASAGSPDIASSPADKKTPSRPPNKSFQRVDPNAVTFLKEDPRLKDNSFQGDEWGSSANRVLSTVKGKGFRHEKTKKKRGSYRGGALDQSVRSVKFE